MAELPESMICFMFVIFSSLILTAPCLIILIASDVLLVIPDSFKRLVKGIELSDICLLYTSPSQRDYAASRMPSSA